MRNYIYPPRIKTILPHSGLVSFDAMDKFLAQVKLNGSSMLLYIEDGKVTTYNRHKERMVCKMDKEELLELGKTANDMVLCGEYMNKNKKDEDGNPWNLKYVIFDILVYNGIHLLGTTFEERQELLKKLYPDNPTKKYLHQITENCFRMESFNSNFKEIYDDITQHDMYEGVCLKRRNGKLENGTTVDNNTGTQFKTRKPTKNYNN